MKMKFTWGLILIASFSLTTLSSCDDDDDKKPSPLVGEWDRDIYVLTELPANFQNFENLEADALYRNEEGYQITFNANGTYSRRISFSGPDVNDTGKWKYEGNELSLDSDDSTDDEEFEVEGEITTNQLVLSQILNFPLLPDNVTDTLTNAWANANPTKLNEYYQDVDVKVLYLFEK
jgi:hypothetical protein